MNAPVRTPVILTDDQYEDMARKGAFTRVGRVELRGGVVVAMSPVYLNHSTMVGAFYLAVTSALERSGSALRANAELTVRFGGGFQPTADVVVWDPATVPADLDGPLPGSAARLVIEVADRSLDDDLGQKLVDYAQAGLAEYWVAEVKGRIVHLCTGPTAEGYATRRTVRFGEELVASTLALAVATQSL
jgi:Uma2 family endonuclease